MAYSRKISKKRILRKKSRKGGGGDDMGHKDANPTGSGESHRSDPKHAPPPDLPQPSVFPPPKADYVFICSTITPKLLEEYSSMPYNVTFGSMIYNLESMFGCGFMRGQPIKQNFVYLPVFLEAAKTLKKVENIQQNEINFIKKVLELLKIEVDDTTAVAFFAQQQFNLFKDDIRYKDKLNPLSENLSDNSYKILEIIGVNKDEILDKSYKAYFVDKLNNNLNNINIAIYNKHKNKELSDILKNIKHSCTPLIDSNKFYTNQISNFVRGEYRLAPEKKKIADFVYKKILKEKKNVSQTIQKEIEAFANGNFADEIDAGENDPHRLECLRLLKQLKNDDVADEEIDRNGLYANFDSFTTDKRKLVEWLTKFVPYKQYENKEDLMHLANFLYCRENNIDKNFFAESIDDFFSMRDNLKKFYEKLTSEEGFKTKHNYTLIHDCEHGDANAVLLFRYLQSKNPQSKFKIIMQVSNKYFSKVPQDERMVMFYDEIDNDNSHDDYHIQTKICGPGNFENSLDEHAKKKLSFLDDDFTDSLIPDSFISKDRLEKLKFLRRKAKESKEAVARGKKRREGIETPSGFLGGTKRRRPTKKRRQTKKRRPTKKRR